jgi:hypothetical protein
MVQIGEIDPFTIAFAENRVSGELGRETLRERGYSAIVKDGSSVRPSISPRPRSFCRRWFRNCRELDFSEPLAPRRSKRIFNYNFRSALLARNQE